MDFVTFNPEADWNDMQTRNYWTQKKNEVASIITVKTLCSLLIQQLFNPIKGIIYLQYNICIYDVPIGVDIK